MTLGKGAATLERFGQVALPPGAVRDGEVVDVDSVASALRQLWAQAKFGSKKVVVGVANQKVVVRQVDLPWMPVEDLRKSLAFQVQDYLPMPVEQAILDFHPLEEFAGDNGGRMLRVLLVAAAGAAAYGPLEAARVYTAPTLTLVAGIGSFLLPHFVGLRGRPPARATTPRPRPRPDPRAAPPRRTRG